MSEHASLLAEAEFGRLLRRERLLSDRTGVRFSLISIDLGADTAPFELPPVARALLPSLRLSDAAGWVRPGVLGFLLAGTPGDGARQFLDRMDRDGVLARGGVTRNRFSVSEYPGTDGPAEGGDPQVGEPIRALTKLRVPRWKRALDVFFASAAILLLSPLLLLVALIIRLGSKGPVLYRQQRVGAGGRLFEMYKFRTFRVSGDGGAHEQYVRQLIRSSADAPEERPMLKLPSSGSLVPLGRFLRSWGLDELPQLLNILRGDMTLVGPRPEVPYVLPEYRPWHHQRFDEVPGLTGLWQVSGKNRLGFTEMVRLDVKYARAKSPLVDLWIMLKTVPALVSYNRPGSRHAQDQATESQR